MRKALCVGITSYQNDSLTGCGNDASMIKNILDTNGDGSPNFESKLYTDIKTKAELKEQIISLFSGDPDIALFYFSGHGVLNSFGGYLVTPDYKPNDEGISMEGILKLANESKARNRVIILDCCYSGKFGNPTLNEGATQIKEGVTILTASRADEPAYQVSGQAVFTALLIDALQGGAADLRGDITPGSIYAYVDQALGEWDQRPVFKTNITRFTSLRKINPPIPFDTLRRIVEYFPSAQSEYALDPSYEFTNSSAIEHTVIEPLAKAENVSIFKDLQKFASVNLVKPVGEEHMYFAAMNSKSCKLTALGYHYWRLVSEKKI